MASFLGITENKRAEEERLTRKKLEGVLEMAGGACHELNQSLMSASGSCLLFSLTFMVFKEFFYLRPGHFWL